jgi:chemotaxis protein methyltransferase CheR
MYFTDAQAAAVLARIARALAPGGYLFLGHADTLRGHASDLTLCHSHGAFYYQRHPTTAPRAASADATDDLAADLTPGRDAGWYDDIHAATRRVHTMVDGALDQKPSPAVVSHAPALASELAEIRALLAQERFGEALERLERLRATCGADRDVAMLHALGLMHTGRFVDARAACTALLAIDATSAGANYLLSLCSDSTGDTRDAVRLAQLAAELDPSFAMPRVHLGLLARRAGDRTIASRELTRAITLLEQEAPSRLAMYGSGFSRQALLGMCRAELAAMAAAP